MYRIGRALMLGFTGLLLAASLVFATLQTRWAKKQVRSWLIETARNNQIDLHLGQIEGNLPFHFTIKQFAVQLPEQNFLTARSVKVRLSLFALLRKEIVLNYVHLHEASWMFIQDSAFSTEEIALQEIRTLPTHLSSIQLPINISIKSLKVSALQVENLSTAEVAHYSLKASGRWKKGGNDFFLNLKVNGPPYLSSYLELLVKGNKKQEFLGGNLKLRFKSLEAFKPLVNLPVEGDCYISMSLEGPWSTWASLSQNNPTPPLSSPLQGSVLARCSRIKLPKGEKINQKCKLEGLFSIASDGKVALDRFSIDSDIAEVKGKATIRRGYQMEYASIYFQLPDFSIFDPYLPIHLQGSLKGQLKVEEGVGSMHFSTNRLKIDETDYEEITCSASAMEIDSLWKGTLQAHAKHTSIPLDLKSDFTFMPGYSFLLSDLILKAPDAEFEGGLEAHFPERKLKAQAYGQIIRLSQFQEFFPNTVLDGSAGGEIRFSSKYVPQEKYPEQNLMINAVGKNLQYQNLSLHELNVNGEIDDLLNHPKGSLTFEAEQLAHPEVFFNSIFVNVTADDDQWPFLVNAQGMWKDDFDVLTVGSAQFTEVSKQIDFLQIQGSVMKMAFHAENPFTISWSPKHFRVSDSTFQVQNGFFRGSLNLEPDRIEAFAHARQFPLEILALAWPHCNLKGASSLDVSLEGNKKQTQGQMNLLLEEANIEQRETGSSLKAKGALNISIDQHLMQVHAHMIASDQQFFDWNATLPVEIQPFPCKLKFDPHRPVSSELTMEGKLEEIFDFVNIGTHQATGLLSCHLFLSKTLASPAISGKIDLQSGSYENYFTGTSLRDIQASAEAENYRIKLLSLTAKDTRNGSVLASGDLNLHPDQKFPFTIHAQMQNLHFLKSEFVDSSFTGDAEIKGNSLSSTVSGDLIVSEARFNIPDELPVDVPVLPVTFINKPPRIRSEVVQPRKIYPLYLDLELSAKKHIFVTGKGVDSEWHGKLHLTGLNTNFAALGKLNLLSGKFVFAGKTFSLNEGEIIFSDKPTPSANLTLSATLQLQNIAITAFLRGPLTAPLLTFQSMPQMPTSSLLSYILFDKDISEINYFQAFQLAQMVVSLSGGDGPGVFEKIRKTLGVDRLGIVAGPKGLEQIAVQIGKYLTKGVLITLSQGAETSQAILEVTLKQGFVFQAETQEDNAGKFILKWHKNY